MLKRLLDILGINKAVLFGVLSKVWFGFAGIITIFLIVRCFSPELQGYYFTFYSLIGLQVFVELGLGVVIVNFTSHEWSKLQLNKNGEIIGDKDALSRLRDLAKLAFRWYIRGGIILTIMLSIIGYFFFSASGSDGISWVYPWLSLCLMTGCSLSILPSFSLLEGSNQVAQVYFYRFVQEIIRSVSTWAIIVAGGKLWAAPGSSLCIIIWAIIFISIKYKRYFKTLSEPVIGSRIDWWYEVWPMQWRIAITWMSGYLFFSLFTPVLFHFHGAVVAGRMGMTWSIVNALSMIASMWIVTKTPKYGMLIAKKEYNELDRLLFHSAVLATVVACLGAAIIFSVTYLIFAFQFEYANRILPPLPTAVFLIAMIVLQPCNALATYLRAHKKEPLMVLSVITSIIIGSLVLITGKIWGALGIAITYFIVNVFLSAPGTILIWIRCRDKWHIYNNIIELGG